MSSRQLADNFDIHCWYAEMQQWFESHGISINDSDGNAELGGSTCTKKKEHMDNQYHEDDE